MLKRLLLNISYSLLILHIKIIILIIQFDDYNSRSEFIAQEYKYEDSTVDKIL